MAVSYIKACHLLLDKNLKKRFTMFCRSMRISHEKMTQNQSVSIEIVCKIMGGVLDFSIYNIAEFGLDYQMPSK